MNETPKTEQAPVAETEAPVDETALSDDQLEGVAGGGVPERRPPNDAALALRPQGCYADLSCRPRPRAGVFRWGAADVPASGA